MKSLLASADITPEQLARRLTARAAQLGSTKRVDPKTPYKWIQGTRPRSPWPDLTAAVLSEALRATVTVEDLGWTSPTAGLTVPADSGLLLPWTAGGALAAAAAVTETGAMERRLFLQLVGTALTEPAFEWLIARPVTDLDGIGRRRVQAVHVDAIDEITAQLRRMDDQFGSGTVLDLVRAQVRHVLNLLRNHSYSEAIGVRLQAASAELLRLAGWLSFDAGGQAQAQRYWLAALRAAHAAGDRAIGANVLGFMSCQAKDLDLYPEAVKLADAARQGYAGASPRVTAILNMRAAQAYAQTREVRETRVAIDTAYEALTCPPPESGDPAWSYWLDEAQINEQIGYSYLRLEDWDRARSHLRTALRMQDDPNTREASLRQALLAITYANQGDPEQACAVASRAVDILSEDVDSDRVVGHVRRVQSALAPYRRLRVVTDFHDRVDTVFQIPA